MQNKKLLLLVLKWVLSTLFLVLSAKTTAALILHGFPSTLATFLSELFFGLIQDFIERRLESLLKD